MADDNQGEGTPFTSHAMRVDIDLVRALAQVLDETDLTEVEVEDGARKVRVVRKPAPIAQATYAPAYAPQPAAQPQLASAATTTIEAGAAVAPVSSVPPVTSPMVGTVYLAANPEAKADERKAAWKDARNDAMDKNLKAYRRALTALARSGVVMSMAPDAVKADGSDDDTGEDA